MTDYTQLANPEAERAIFARMLNIDKAERLNYASKGLMAREVKQRLLWRERIDPETGVPCRSFARWLRCCCPYGYSGVYAALEDVEALKDVPDEHLALIPPSNFQTMKQLSTAVRAKPDVLEAAKTQRAEVFVETLRRTEPTQHLEHRKLLRFRPTESAAAKIEEALAMAEERGASGLDESLEMIAATAVEQWKYEKEVEDAHAKSAAR